MDNSSGRTGTGWTKNTGPEPGLISPLIARVLQDETYYGDGPPNWPKARSSNDAKEARIRYVKRLRRFASQFPEATALANLLGRCKPRRRCKSGACPECARAFQRWYVAQVASLADEHNVDQLIRISLVFPDRCTDADNLQAITTTNLIRFIAETARRAEDVNWAVGGIDVSLNDITQKDQGVFWQPQLYLIADMNDGRSIFSELLRDGVHSSEIVHRPVQVALCDGSLDSISYAFKTDFVRRISYWGKSARSQNSRESWHTRKVSLRAPENVQALVWMHKIGFRGRLFLHGVRMTRNGAGVGLAKIKKLE
jgi:hypothetical protein